MRRNRRNLNLKTPLGIGLLAAAFSVALAAVLCLVPARTVQANASRPASAPSAGLSAQAATPASLRAQESRNSGKKNRLSGFASWYGEAFEGRKTASGERFDMFAMTACHPTLPFGSLVRVINLKNRLSVVVRITDRGDLVDQGRVIDLSYGAAQKLAMIQSGLAPVKLQVLRMGEPGGN